MPESQDHPDPVEAPADPAQDAGAKLVPVVESIKYRRRAQQAEGQLEQLQQQVRELQQNLDRRSEEIAAAEAQRDEAQQQLSMSHNRLTAERMMAQAGVIDPEAAWLLLSKRVDLGDELEGEALSQAVEQLLLDKPFLRAPQSPMPAKTASPRQQRTTLGAQLAQAAQQAAHSGDRRDVAQYLRLRRQAANRSY